MRADLLPDELFNLILLLRGGDVTHQLDAVTPMLLSNVFVVVR
jgi:hypothetical protein